ncbi:Hypothetical predicted protein [Octopus vulgaris]|uniref:Uncharacterized protein n=1 Tax=Octopus vulgaris TaxID=6645 RepID=A0AA36AIL9_OCTVU|nr:Hypothetical predicted protein [Octopus vulgaris]
MGRKTGVQQGEPKRDVTRVRWHEFEAKNLNSKGSLEREKICWRQAIDFQLRMQAKTTILLIRNNVAVRDYVIQCICGCLYA